jgi:hypothetical protein
MFMNGAIFVSRLKQLSDVKDGSRRLTPTLRELGLDPNLPRSVLTHSPSVDVVEALAMYYNVSVDYLLGFSDSEERHNQSTTDFSQRERELLNAFRDLSDRDKDKLIGQAEYMAQQEREAKKKEA